MVVMMYVLTIYQCGMSFECRLPDNMILLSTILYMSWLVLDNIDGKQARRTHSSSPLGLMFDHQVDALNVTITTSYFANVMMGPHIAIKIWLVGALPFYFTTWEETYTGSLTFPFFSAASDGCLLLGLLSLFFYFITPEPIIFNSAFGVEIRELILYGMLISAMMIVVYK
jgi:phosphatidylglycerophosphate synthase